MSNPQYPYAQPGPSSYYQPQPHFPPNGHYGYPPPAAYAPYGYPMPPVDGSGLHAPASPHLHAPPSPRMQHAQASPRMHAQPSPRLNGTGRGQPFVPRNPAAYGAPAPGYPPHPLTHGQWAPYAQKYPPPGAPYSPMGYPLDGYAPPWQPHPQHAPPLPHQQHQQLQQQQHPPPALSPLPKQLSMLSSVGSSPYSPHLHTPSQLRREESYDGAYTPTPPLPQQQQQQQQQGGGTPRGFSPALPPAPPPPVPAPEPPRSPPPREEVEEEVPRPPSQEVDDGLHTVQEEEETDDAPTPVEETPPAELAPPAVASPEPAMPAIPPTLSFQSGEELPEAPEPDALDGAGGWAVWSRRPADPALAPALVFSTRARARTALVQRTLGGAIADTTPPGSPALKRAVLAATLGAPGADPEASLDASDARTDAGMTVASIEAQPPSSAVTETEPSEGRVTPTPGSPVSSQTSLSVSPSAAVPAPPATDKVADLAGPAPIAVASGTTVSTTVGADIAPVAIPVTEERTAPAAAPAVAVAKPKSWASLLRSDGAGSSKTGLPSSAVVGFSVPAGAQASPTPPVVDLASLPVAPGARQEVASLLTRDPAGFAGWAPRIRPRGLVNSGNMCFANAVLQTLVYCPPFVRLFNELGRHLLGPAPGKERERRTPIVEATVQFLKEFEVKERTVSVAGGGRGKGKEREVEDEEEWGVDSFMPTYVYDAMKEKKRFESMRSGQQEDAEEFLGFYLDTLEEELLTILQAIQPSALKAPEPLPTQDAGWMEVGKRNKTVVTRSAKSTESPITRMFGGKFRSTLRAPHQKESVMVEDWRALQLDIQPETVLTIKDALAQLTHPQTVQITSPTRAGQTIDASQSVLIDSLPPILVLHLKRFLYDTNVKDVVKIGKKIAFEPELEIGTNLMAPSTRGIVRPAKYKLFGVLYHHGLSASGGHYTLDVLHPNRDLSTRPREAWIRIDDELVSDVRPEDVFGGLERDDRCAYLLFYRRIGGGALGRP